MVAKFLHQKLSSTKIVLAHISANEKYEFLHPTYMIKMAYSFVLLFVFLKYIAAVPISTTGTQSIGKKFDSMSDLLDSLFFQTLRYDEGRYQNTEIALFLKDRNSTLFVLNDNQVKSKVKRGLRESFRRKKAPRDIRMIEVQLKEGYSMYLPHIPLSPCVSSRYSSGGATFSQTYSKTIGLSLTISPEVSISIMQLGITLSGSLDSLSLSQGISKGISCSAPVGGRVQIIGSVSYMVYPNARKRNLMFRGDYIEEGDWDKIQSSEPQYKDYGAVFFKNGLTAQNQCVTKEEYLKCDLFERTWGEGNHLDGLKGLAVARKSQL